MYLRSFCIWCFLGWLVTWWETPLDRRHRSDLDRCRSLPALRDLWRNMNNQWVRVWLTPLTVKIDCFGWFTLLGHWSILHLVLPVLSLIRDLARDRTRHVQFVDVQSGFTEGGHGGVHACIAIGGAAEGGQVESFAPSDDGDVEGELAPAVGGWVFGDGERRGRGELSAGSGGGWRLSVQQFTVLTAGKEQLQRPETTEDACISTREVSAPWH